MEPETRPTVPILDEDALNNIRSLQRPDRPDILKKIIGLYLNDSPAQLRSLRESVESQNLSALQEVAHSLKSASANLGALALASLCRDLEIKGRDKSSDGMETILLEIEEQYPLVEGELKSRLRHP